MRRYHCFLTLLLVAACARPSLGQVSVTQSVAVRVEPILALGASGDPVSLVLGLAGREASAEAAFAFTSNLSGVVLSAALDAPMPPGLRLSLEAESDLGRNLGPVDLTEAAAPLVLDLRPGAVKGQRLAYRLTGRMRTGPPLPQTRRIRLVLTDPRTGISAETTQVVRLDAVPTH